MTIFIGLVAVGVFALLYSKERHRREWKAFIFARCTPDRRFSVSR